MIDYDKKTSPNLDATEPHRPILVDAGTAAGLLSIGKRLLWTLTNRGDIPSIRIGRCVRYSIADLNEFVEQMRRS